MEAFHCRVNTPLCNSNNYNTNFLASMQRMISVQPCNYARLLSVSCSSAAPPAKNNKRRTSRDYSAKTSITTSRTGSSNPAGKPQKLNSEVSPHRAVSAVRLMRIELGGAFADLLNDQGKGSGDNEMGYVERTLGFRTRNLDDRDLRL
ncbi:probable 28S rRNA (cytosine-C(5))-methyltransferase isoform X1, partial [Olea europaea subsp. europaea]